MTIPVLRTSSPALSRGSVEGMSTDPRYPIGKFSPPSNLSPQDRDTAIQSIFGLPQKLRAAVDGLSETQLDTAYREGGWTVRQTVHHVADSHMQATGRVRMALTEDWPLVAPYQESLWAELPDARTQPVEISLQLLDAIQTRWAALLRSIKPADWTTRGYTHPQNGKQSLGADRRDVCVAWPAPHGTDRSPARPDGMVDNPPLPPAPEQLALQLQTFLKDQPAAVLVENGRILFDLRQSRLSVASEHGHCVLHVWSEERDLVRNVIDITVRKVGLRLHVLRMGQTKPQTLELHPQQCRLPSQREATRTRFTPLLERLLPRYFPDCKVEGLRTAMDLERSFGPAYARGMLVRGNSAWAVIAVNSEESQALVDGILTLGVLWLHHCREQSNGRRIVEGLRLIVPRGKSALTAARLTWMNPRAATWELYELDEKAEELYARDARDQGNLDSHLVHVPNTSAADERFRSAVQRVRAVLPADAAAQMEIVFRTGNEVGLLWNGLEFARIRSSVAENSFARSEEILFGSGANATLLTEESAPKLRAIVEQLILRRRTAGDKRDTLYRQQPERWLESMIRRSPDSIDAMIEPYPVYAQVPAFSAADRAVLDLLAVRRDGRLVVIEIKAAEDLHFALQALDYWIRVRRHHHPAAQSAGSGGTESDLKRFGYFPTKQLRPEAPLLYLVAPALRIHSATEIVLRYISPEVDWTLIALDERWREKIRVVFRKHRQKS